MDYDEIAERMLIPPGKRVRLKDHDPDWLLTKEMDSLSKEQAKQRSVELLEQSRQELIKAQDLVYANGRYAVLIDLQGRDAAGKDRYLQPLVLRGRAGGAGPPRAPRQRRP
jgi:polyphosphate kinase 2 (PPK2 family)